MKKKKRNTTKIFETSSMFLPEYNGVAHLNMSHFF